MMPIATLLRGFTLFLWEVGVWPLEQVGDGMRSVVHPITVFIVQELEHLE